MINLPAGNSVTAGGKTIRGEDLSCDRLPDFRISENGLLENGVLAAHHQLGHQLLSMNLVAAVVAMTPSIGHALLE